MNDLSQKGWQLSIGYHYFVPGGAVSLCGKEYRRDGVRFYDDEPVQSCLVCFCKLQALSPQPEMFEERDA